MRIVWGVTLVACLLGASCATEEAPNSLIFASSADATTLDPHNTTDSQSDQVIWMLYNALIRYDENMKFVPESRDQLVGGGRRRYLDVQLAGGRALSRRRPIRCPCGQSELRSRSRSGARAQTSFVVPSHRSRRSRRRLYREHRDQVFLRRIRADDGARVGRDREPEDGGGKGQGLRLLRGRDRGHGPYRVVRWRKDLEIIIEPNDDYWERRESSIR